MSQKKGKLHTLNKQDIEKGQKKSREIREQKAKSLDYLQGLSKKDILTEQDKNNLYMICKYIISNNDKIIKQLQDINKTIKNENLFR